MSNISYSAIKTIIFSEIKKYFKEFQFNIISPLVNTLLFVFIMTTINRYYSFANTEESYVNFLIPGIVMAVIMQTSFSHLSELIINMKQIGSFNDFLISPISRIEIFLSLISSSIFVCLFSTFFNLFILSYYSDFKNINYPSLLYYMIVANVIFSSIGALTGWLSFTWDAKSSVSNFFIIPISFLSGTFFSIESVESRWQFLFQYNPFYYLVSGFRGSFIHSHKINYLSDIYVLLILLFVFLISIFIFKKGYRVIT